MDVNSQDPVLSASPRALGPTYSDGTALHSYLIQEDSALRGQSERWLIFSSTNRKFRKTVDQLMVSLSYFWFLRLLNGTKVIQGYLSLLKVTYGDFEYLTSI